MRLSTEKLEEIQNQLAYSKVQQFDRKVVWLLMHHIDEVEAELSRANKSADFLQDAVIDLLRRSREGKKVPMWRQLLLGSVLKKK